MECLTLDEMLSYLNSNNTLLILEGTYLSMRNTTGLTPLDPMMEVYLKFPGSEELKNKKELIEEIDSLSLAGDNEQAAYKRQELAILNNAEQEVTQLKQIDLSYIAFYKDNIARLEVDVKRAEESNDYKAAAEYKQKIGILKLAIEKSTLPVTEKLEYYKDQVAKARETNDSIGLYTWRDAYIRESGSKKSM